MTGREKLEICLLPIAQAKLFPLVSLSILVIILPVVSYPWTFRTQAKTFRTHFRSVRTQPSGRFVPKKL